MPTYSVLQVEDVDVDNEASMMSRFGHQPSFGNENNNYYSYFLLCDVNNVMGTVAGLLKR